MSYCHDHIYTCPSWLSHLSSWYTPVLSSPRPLPVEKHLKMTILMSRPSWIQILFMILITCRVSMSCRRSSPDWTETETPAGVKGQLTEVRYRWKPNKQVNQVRCFTLKMTLTLSPRRSRFWKDSLRGTALELKKEHDCKRQRRRDVSRRTEAS